MLVPLAVKVAPPPSIVMLIRCFLRVGHLTGNRAFPNQVKQAELIRIQFAFDGSRAPETEFRRADRLVSLLGVLDFVRVDADLGVQEVDRRTRCAPDRVPRRSLLC